MRTAVDTNVISALWSAGPLAAQMVALLGRACNEGGLVICGPVYAELLAHPKATEQFLDEFLSATNVSVDFELDEAVWREAGRRFASYARRRRRSRGRDPKRLLVDFLIGAHASLHRRSAADPGRSSIRERFSAASTDVAGYQHQARSRYSPLASSAWPRGGLPSAQFGSFAPEASVD